MTSGVVSAGSAASAVVEIATDSGAGAGRTKITPRNMLRKQPIAIKSKKLGVVSRRVEPELSTRDESVESEGEANQCSIREALSQRGASQKKADSPNPLRTTESAAARL